MRGVAEVKEPCSLPMLSVDMENKENGSLGVKNSMENGRPPDPADWAVMDVVNYFRTAGFEEQARAFQEQRERESLLKAREVLIFLTTPPPRQQPKGRELERP
ncbi:sterile alpha motif domain-containing protein 13 isoform X3 [Saccopteryx bilineata]|uniref:sterile alpha motif domain-containing protein 13 isoform X3 n=1 Tax=Saccopteryx bilineata TaxID=59482 RepID=UPI00339068D6